MMLDLTISALADPTRRALLRRLADGPRRASALAEGFAMSRPAVCKHTRLLAKAGLIRARSSGRERIYELDPRGGQAIKELIMEFAEMERFWEVALEAFKRYAEENS
jgi:DNA-binding transcriptional ArsR family regulator